MKVCKKKYSCLVKNYTIIKFICNVRYSILKLYFQKGLIACNFLNHQNVEPLTPQKHCLSKCCWVSQLA